MKGLCILVSLTFFCHAGQVTRIPSPDGKFSVTIGAREGIDQQVDYTLKLTDHRSNQTTEITTCTRRDLPAPRCYWNKHSTHVIFEQCSDTFNNSSIVVLNVKTKQPDIRLNGLMVNGAETPLFDFENGVLLYYDTTVEAGNRIPPLWSLDLKTKKRKKIVEFDVEMDIEFPLIKLVKGKRELVAVYTNPASGQTYTTRKSY